MRPEIHIPAILSLLVLMWSGIFAYSGVYDVASWMLGISGVCTSIAVFFAVRYPFGLN
jgi:hypothetical protein